MFSDEERAIIACAHAQLYVIPEDEFDMYVYTNRTNKCCAVGHLQRLNSDNPNNYDPDNCNDYSSYRMGSKIRELSKRFLKDKVLTGDITDVNNNDISLYNQPTVKQRVMALLEDMLNHEQTNK